MYQDPKLIRKHVVKIRLSDREHELIQALVNYTGAQKAALIRELVMERAQSVLFADNNSREACR